MGKNIDSPKICSTLGQPQSIDQGSFANIDGGHGTRSSPAGTYVAPTLRSGFGITRRKRATARSRFHVPLFAHLDAEDGGAMGLPVEQRTSPRCGAVLAMAPQTPVGRINKDLRVHAHVEPTVCNPSTGKYKRMGFIGLNDAELEILIKRGARNRLPLAHGSPLRNQRDHGAKPSGGPCDLSIGRRFRPSTGAL